MIDPTLHKGDNIVVNLISKNYVLEIHDSQDGIGESVKKINVHTRMFYGHVVRVLRCGKDFHSIEIKAPSISEHNLMFSDLKGCFIQKV